MDKMFFKKKKNNPNYFYNFVGFLQFFGLIILCSGSKSCPESTRPHLTRCDKYFRCTQLPNKTYVWVPAQCDQGLVYEPSLKLCVLPGDNWECNLTEEFRTNDQISNDENNVYGVNNIPLSDYSSEEITINDDKSTLFGDTSTEIDDSAELYIETTMSPSYSTSDFDANDDEYESSGDGNIKLENKEYVINNNHIKIPESIDIDNKLASHLQRLTQLIDSIKNQNSTNGTKNELMADQLNHFLDNYNLMAQQVDMTNDTNKIPVPDDWHMHPDHIDEIISQQNKLTIDDVMKQGIKKGEMILYPIKESNVNIKLNSNLYPVEKGYRNPEANYHNTEGNYHSPEGIIPNSQIIINRPGGSVLFNIDSNNNPQKESASGLARDEPLISEETLRTVLELSKQMVKNQNNRQAYPIYYTVPIPMITSKSPNHNDKKHTATKHVNERPPISVTNSFNTYGEDLTHKGIGISNGGHKDNSNNISTTVIFDDHSSAGGWNSHKYHPFHLEDTYQNYPNPFLQKPNTNSQFANSYFPSYDSYQPYYSNYQSPNQYQKPNSFYQDPLDMYPPYLTPFYPASPETTTTTPAPTTTSTTTTTTEIYEGEGIDDYEDGDDNMKDEIGISPMNYYNPLASSLGLLQLNDDNQDKLINFGGNFISYNTYRNTLLPLLQPTPMNGGLEILTCSSGVRQPNTTDCTRYYVCNPHTQNVLSYSCPPFTAFNKGSKICDAKSYAVCKPEAIMNRYTVAENMRLQQEVDKLRNEAIKSQAIASIIQSQSPNLGIMSSMPMNVIQAKPGQIITTQSKPNKRHRIRCYDTGKIADPDSNRNYWSCFRGSNGRMKRQKMTCANGLIFCKKMRFCTLAKKC